MSSQSSKSVGLLVAAIMLLASSLTVSANAQSTTTLRNPLIPGAQSTDAGQSPFHGAPPPIGSGSTPQPVTPGMSGSPVPPPSDVPNIPPMSALQHFQVSALVQPYLTPPPSTPGADPGMLPPGLNGIQPDAAIVNVNSGGGLPDGQAPTKRRQGQMTSDYGGVRTRGSMLTDFGQLLPNQPNLATQPQYSQDGTRPTMNGGLTGVNRSPNMTGAQTTQDMGYRMNFDGQTRPTLTIAPY
jgi:hypothetical protein